MIINNPSLERFARNDYQHALNKAFSRKIRKRLGIGCHDLLSFGQVHRLLRGAHQEDLGYREVRIERIVGSSGRYNDFDLGFLPLRLSRDDRWIDVDKAHLSHIDLPPVILYKVGEAYFVEDGNHRISVARYHGHDVIGAHVIEIDVSSLTPEKTCTRLGYKI
jgi:hypothetical protein